MNETYTQNIMSYLAIFVMANETINDSEKNRRSEA